MDEWNFTDPKLDERLIVALDMPSRRRALRLLRDAGDSIRFVKIGYELFIAEGMGFVRKLTRMGYRVFLDLKMRDIETTVYRAVRQIAASDVSMLTADGSPTVVRAAKKARDDMKATHLQIIAVTALSDASVRLLFNVDSSRSSDADKFEQDIRHYVQFHADQAVRAGADGLVVSGENIALVRGHHPDVPIVAPGIRNIEDCVMDDHNQTLSSYDAIRDGATYLVVGRPIRRKKDPRVAVKRIVADIARGLENRV